MKTQYIMWIKGNFMGICMNLGQELLYLVSKYKKSCEHIVLIFKLLLYFHFQKLKGQNFSSNVLFSIIIVLLN